ncbi:MAG: DUF3800 domain-containing protein [Gammaproteobacteria bacterium]|nr:DUF3800 domain-containing protein [Gammaproteobacteria bacterium]MDD9855645.1 DUF3800 domain-containing protein [Gammaproteobacteria bacterium]
MKDTFSDYIVYVDESGDHGLVAFDREYPVFVLAFCVFQKKHYLDYVVPQIQQFKFRHFGHDSVILHESDIRKDRGDFNFLKSRESKEAFMNELNRVVENAQFTLICTAINKEKLKEKYTRPYNPYNLALLFGLERVYSFLQRKNQLPRITHVVVERRGKKEDNALELSFRRYVDGRNDYRVKFPLELVFADKQINSAGLQLADLVARPVGLSLIRPQQTNRAFQIIEKKLYKVGGKATGWGLKYFP